LTLSHIYLPACPPFFSSQQPIKLNRLAKKKDGLPTLPDYIDKNTSISTHQNINVYGKPKKKYEVLLSSRAVDVRLLVV
jgi:pyrimidine operon attenuation protein/uracil phosphoribosyltransferase